MAIDPSIITDTIARWQTPAAFDPLAQYAKIQALKSGIQEQQLRNLQMQQVGQAIQTGALDLQEKQQQIVGQKALSDAITQNMTAGPNGMPVINHAGVAQALGASGFGHLIPKYQEGVATQQKNAADAQKLQLENQASMLDQATRYFSGANNQADWDDALAHAAGLGADPAKLGIPATYSPENKATVLNLGVAGKDRLDASIKALEAQTKQAAEQREQHARDVTDADAAMKALAGANADNFQTLRDAALIAQTKAGRSPGAIPGTYSEEGQAAFNEALRTPQEKALSAQAAATLEETKRQRDETARHNRMQESIEATRNQLQQTAMRGDRSYQSATHELDQIGKPVSDTVQRLTRLQDTLAQNSPQADALVAPELLSVMAGGSGSGLRMNEAEISRIVGGRSKWEDLKAAINKWQLDPTKATSITPEQRKEIRDLTSTVSDRIYAKQNALNEAYKTVAGSQDPNEHRQAVLAARQAISDIDMPGGAGAGVAPPMPARLSQADVGKTYTSKQTGKPIKITAVNPADATQFKFEEVK